MSVSPYASLFAGPMAGLLVSAFLPAALAAPISVTQPEAANPTYSGIPPFNLTLPAPKDNLGRCKLMCALNPFSQFKPGCVNKCIRLDKNQPRPCLNGQEAETDAGEAITSIIVKRTDVKHPTEWNPKPEADKCCKLVCADSQGDLAYHKCIRNCSGRVEVPQDLPTSAVKIDKRTASISWNSSMSPVKGPPSRENVLRNCRLACGNTQDQDASEITACVQTCVQRHEESPVGFLLTPSNGTAPANGTAPVVGPTPVAGTTPPQKRSVESVSDLPPIPIETASASASATTTNNRFGTPQQIHDKCDAICKVPGANTCTAIYPWFQDCVYACLTDPAYWIFYCGKDDKGSRSADLQSRQLLPPHIPNPWLHGLEPVDPVDGARGVSASVTVSAVSAEMEVTAPATA